MKTLSLVFVLFASVGSAQEVLPEIPGTHLKFATVEEATARLKQFPAQEQEALTQPRAAEFCNRFRKWNYWWLCEGDIVGNVYNQQLLDFVVEISSGEQFFYADQLMWIAANRYVDGEAFRSATTFVAPGFWGEMLKDMVDHTYDPELVPMCNSRANALGNLVNPIMSARTFNQQNMLDCLKTIRDREVTLSKKIGVTLCKAKMDVVSRTQCLAEVFKD